MTTMKFMPEFNVDRGCPSRSKLDGVRNAVNSKRMRALDMLRLRQPLSIRWLTGAAALIAAICWVTPVSAQDTNDSDVTTTDDSSTNSAGAIGPHVYGPGLFRVGPEGRRVPIVFRKDVVIRSNEWADVVVVIGGSAKVHGNVHQDVVTICGDIELDGQARDVVAVLGGIKLGPGAKVQHDVAAIGGALDIAEGANVHRRPFELDLGGVGVGARQWVLHGLFMARPFAPQVGWLWMLAFFFFLLYVIIALIMPASVQACATELGRRPATTFFLGVLTLMLVPFIFVILAATGIGAIIIPFILAALVFGGLIGKTALFEALGFAVGNRFGASFLRSPLLALLIGIILVTVLYMVPIVGFLALGVIAIWGLGSVVTTAAGSLRRESPAPVAATPEPSVPAAGSTGIPAATEPSATAPAPVAPANLPEALTQRRANFWERMGAGFLDWVIVGVIGGLVHGPPLAFLAALAYFAGMWAWKGTTLGGVVLGLKVVRLDGQPVTFLVALVRALACVLSIFVFFLGFLWIGWDREKQGWHDKIAGTVVVRLPRSVPLVCL